MSATGTETTSETDGAQTKCKHMWSVGTVLCEWVLRGDLARGGGWVGFVLRGDLARGGGWVGSVSIGVVWDCMRACAGWVGAGWPWVGGWVPCGWAGSVSIGVV